jgi:hypothetical protein
MLADDSVCRAARVLASEPNPLPGVLLCRQRSYFSYIPSHFGHTVALDDAFRCLITVAHSKLVPSHRSSDGTILSNYSKALQSLQSAVSDRKTRYSTEILCATAILAVFEVSDSTWCESDQSLIKSQLLNSPNGKPWSQHIAGAARLIQLRGPSRFTSEFDKSLFISLTYPIVSIPYLLLHIMVVNPSLQCAQSLLNNEYCFLDDPTWNEVMKAIHIPSETFSDRSKLGIELMMLKPKVSGLVKRTNHAVLMQDTLQPEDFEAITVDLHAARSTMVNWRRKFNTALIHAHERCREDPLDFSKRYELLGVALVVHILLSRLLCSMVPNERGLLEEEVQNLALELKTIQGSLGHNRRAELFFNQKAKIGDAVIATHKDFREVVNSGRIVELWRLEKFFDALGRKNCDGKTCCDPNL